MNITDVKRLLKLLGRSGTIAGIRESQIDAKVLRNIATRSGLKSLSSPSRDELILIIVDHFDRPALKPTEELMQMSYDELVSYFNDVSPSNDELMRVIKELDYKVSAEDRKHLRRFAARQISESALFAKVAARES